MLSDNLGLIITVALLQGFVWGGYCYALAIRKRCEPASIHLIGGFFFGIANMLYLMALPTPVELKRSSLIELKKLLTKNEPTP